ncbi:DNA-binding protein [Rhodoligotrophos ferricapiens]|uniref:DNA-binding protein n=1 Tax=Rhodoligotrophos ferricapiens TaxID=3069264 RepID=UPI00315DFFFF
MDTNTEGLDLLWEVAAIAKLIGRSERQTFNLLAGGQLPAKKVGGRWVASRQKLIAFFLEDAA